MPCSRALLASKMVESDIRDAHLIWVPMSILNVSTKRSRSLSRHFPYSLNLAWSAAGEAKPHNRGCNRNLDNGFAKRSEPDGPTNLSAWMRLKNKELPPSVHNY